MTELQQPIRMRGMTQVLRKEEEVRSPEESEALFPLEVVGLEESEGVGIHQAAGKTAATHVMKWATTSGNVRSKLKLDNIDKVEKYLISPFTHSELSSEELAINKLVETQRDILNNFAIPKDGIHSVEAQNFYDKMLNAPQDVKDILRDGYSPPCIAEPPSNFYRRNNMSARRNIEFVRQVFGLFLI